MIVENNNCLKDQRKGHFLKAKMAECIEREYFFNHQFERALGMSSLPWPAQINTNLQVSKWSHRL